MENNAENRLATEPVKGLLLKLAAPAVLAQLVSLLYNIVDRIYVGHIENVGADALAGLGVTFPIIIFVSAFALLIGIGGAPRAAIAMGAGRHEKAEHILGNSITLIAALSVILFLVFYGTRDAILMAFGASEATLPYASSYLGVYLFGTLFVLVTVGLNPFITTQGFAKTSMLTTCVGCVLNIILDPIFIFVFDMGVVGAAVATVISQCASAVWVTAFLFGKKSLLKVRVENLRLRADSVKAIISLGISPFIMQATECFVQLVFNRGMQTYGDDRYVAVMAVLFSLVQIIFLPTLGVAQGAQPIISYNYGAKNFSRVRETYRLLLTVNLTFSCVIVAVIELFPRLILGVFLPEPALVELGVAPLRIFIAGMLLFGALCASQQSFLALGQAKISMFCALFRKAILLIPLAIVLPKAGLGIWGLFISEPISDVAASTTATVLFKLRAKNLLRTDEAQKI